MRTSILGKTKRQTKSIESTKKFEFVKYINNNASSLFNLLHTVIENTPPSVNNLDLRMTISERIISALVLYSPSTFLKIENSHYDLLFKNKLKISVKSQSEIFERQSIKTGCILKEKPIVIKNCLSYLSKTINNDNWDFLLAIEKQNISKGIKLSFGICTFNTVKKNSFLRGDQISMKIKNMKWDYLRKSKKYFSEYSPEEKRDLDRIFKEKQSRLYEAEILRNRISYSFK